MGKNIHKLIGYYTYKNIYNATIAKYNNIHTIKIFINKTKATKMGK